MFPSCEVGITPIASRSGCPGNATTLDLTRVGCSARSRVDTVVMSKVRRWSGPAYSGRPALPRGAGCPANPRRTDMSAGRHIFKGMGAAVAEQDQMAARVLGQALSRRRMLAGAMTSVGAVALTACADSGSDGDAAGATEDPADDAETLVAAHRDAHVLWNDRDLESFIPTFMPVIHYLEVASGHEISDPDEMIEVRQQVVQSRPRREASGRVLALRDQRGINSETPPRRCLPEVAGDTWTVGMCALTGTQTGPLPDGQPTTNKPFNLELASHSSAGKGSPVLRQRCPAVEGDRWRDVLQHPLAGGASGLDTPPDLPVGI